LPGNPLENLDSGKEIGILKTTKKKKRQRQIMKV
jgi:hypothetical protein